MGSTPAWWTAALDERIKVCVDICSLTDYQALIETNALAGHGLYYVPGLLKYFTTAQINALASFAGWRPRCTYACAGLKRIDSALRKVHVEAGAPGA
ncbi:MAG: hypothetical protein ABI210_13405 [Abditibacteriaceae bacterium]